ncbi:MAG: DUF309 domain-containing protein [Alphaproteobacteria bacterium]
MSGVEFPFPSYAHIPGVNSRHPEGLFLDVKAMAPAVSDAKSLSSNAAWDHGLALLSEGYYWECHEVLEAIWLKALPNSRERGLIQGVIQLANALLKQKSGQRKGATRLAAIAVALLEEGEASGVGMEIGMNISQLIVQGQGIVIESSQKCIIFRIFDQISMHCIKYTRKIQ